MYTFKHVKMLNFSNVVLIAQISPADIETVLLSHFAVLDAGVTGRDSSLGDLLVGVIKLKQDQNIEADQVVSYVNGTREYKKCHRNIEDAYNFKQYIFR